MEGLEKLLEADQALGAEGKDAMDFIREKRQLETQRDTAATSKEQPGTQSDEVAEDGHEDAFTTLRIPS